MGAHLGPFAHALMVHGPPRIRQLLAGAPASSGLGGLLGELLVEEGVEEVALAALLL